MNDLQSFLNNLMALSLQPMPRTAIALLPAAIALCAWASMRARSDNRIRAWVQLITAILLTIWMALPYSRDLPEYAIASLQSSTLFAFGYLIQDWFREAWRANLDPRWAHLLVIAVIALSIVALAFSDLP